MDIIKSVFKFKKADADKLPRYGFTREGEKLVYRTFICGTLRLTVVIGNDGSIKTEVWDTEAEEPYTLFLVEGAAGEFVGKVREEYTRVLEDIAANCFETQIFKCENTAKIIEYARKTYGDEAEYLWEDLPYAAVIRRKDNRKWYALFMTIPAKKLGLDGNEPTEIIDLRFDVDELPKKVDGVSYFHGYHMNKKHWITILLDGSVSLDEILGYVDKSYDLAKKS